MNLSGAYFRTTTCRLSTDTTSKLCLVGMYYQALDPFAVKFLFDSHTHWRVSREYLTDGLLAPGVGELDIRIRRIPGLVRIWQHCQSGWIALDIDVDILSEFLIATKEVVPEGGEFGFCPPDPIAELEAL